MKCLEAIQQTQITGKPINSICFENNDESSSDFLSQSQFLTSSNFIIQSKSDQNDGSILQDHFLAKSQQEVFFCASCCKRRAANVLLELNQKKIELNKMKDNLRVSLQRNQRGEKELIVSGKEQELYLLTAKNKKLKEQFEAVRQSREDEMLSQMSIRQEKLRRRELELKEVQESIHYKESLLLSLRSDLRLLQAKRGLKTYQLYEINAGYPNFSIVTQLKRVTYNCIIAEESDIPTIDTRILLCPKIQDSLKLDMSNSVQLYTQNTYGESVLKMYEQITTTYSLANLLRFLHEIIVIKGFLVPFPSFLDTNKLPYYYIGLVNAKEVTDITQKQYVSGNLSEKGKQVSKTANEQKSISSKKSKQFRSIFESVQLVNDEDLIFPWINFAMLLKRLGVNFSQEVLSDSSATFPVRKIKEVFEQEIASLPPQLQNKENPILINQDNDLSIQSEVLRIIYSKRVLERIADEDVSDFINQEGNHMQIIQISELKSRIINVTELIDDSNELSIIQFDGPSNDYNNQQNPHPNHDKSNERDDDDDDGYEII